MSKTWMNCKNIYQKHIKTQIVIEIVIKIMAQVIIWWIVTKKILEFVRNEC
jgi:hypothetical protein